MSRRDAQTDPFNAGDPTMPWDSEPHDAGSPDSSASQEEAAERGRKRSETAKRQPARRGRERSTASSPKSKTNRDTHDTAKSKAEKKDDKRVGCETIVGSIFVMFVALCVLIGIVTFFMVSCSDSDSGTSDDSSETQSQAFDYDAVQSLLIEQEQDALKRRLDALVEKDEATVKQVAGHIDADFAHYDPELTLESVGIDPTEIARWYLDHTTYDLSDSDETGANFYAYTDDGNTSWVCRAFFHVTAPGPGSVTWNLASFAYNLKQQHDGMLTDADKQGIRAKLEELEGQAEQQDNYVSVDFVGTCDEDGSNAKATIDEDSWDKVLSQVYSTFC